MITYGKVAIIGLISSVVLLSGCAGPKDSKPSPNMSEASQGVQDGIEAVQEKQKPPSPPPNPKVEWVEVPNSGGMKKLCDGQVMIYKDSGFREVAIAGVYPHPECPPD